MCIGSVKEPVRLSSKWLARDKYPPMTAKACQDYEVLHKLVLAQWEWQ